MSTPGTTIEGVDRVRLASALQRYRTLANVVGVLLVVLCLVGLPLNEAHLVNPAWFPVGSDAQQVGDAISKYLGVAHGWLYMLFLLLAFALSRRAGRGTRGTPTTAPPVSTPRQGHVGVSPRGTGGRR
jgi:hypothetical protein